MSRGDPDLVADDGLLQRRVGLAPALERVVGDADRADSVLVQEGAHTAHDDGVRNQRVRLVDLVEGNGVKLQPGGAGCRAAPDVGWEWGDGEEFAGHDGRFALVTQGRTQDSFAPAGRVNLGGVEQGDAQFEGAVHDGHRGV